MESQELCVCQCTVLMKYEEDTLPLQTSLWPNTQEKEYNDQLCWGGCSS